MPKLCDVYHKTAVTSSGTSIDINLTTEFGKTFDMSRTWVIVTNKKANGDVENWKLGYYLKDNNTVTLELSYPDTIEYALQLVEFTVASGIKVYRGSGTVSSGTPEVDSIGATITINECHVDVCGKSAGTDLGGEHFLHAEITSTTQVTITIDIGSSRGYRWQVVDWNGTAKVHQVDDVVGATDGNHDITVPSADVSWTKRAVIGSSRTSDGSIDFDEVYRVYPLNDTALHCQRYSNNLAFTATYQVIEFSSSDWSVQRKGGFIADTDYLDDVGVTSLDTSRSFILPGGHFQWVGRSEAPNDDYGDGGFRFYFTSGTNVRIERDDNDYDAYQSCSVIEDVGVGGEEEEVNLHGNLQGNLNGGFQ